jgi:hypothetical protein
MSLSLRHLRIWDFFNTHDEYRVSVSAASHLATCVSLLAAYGNVHRAGHEAMLDMLMHLHSVTMASLIRWAKSATALLLFHRSRPSCVVQHQLN